MKKTWIILICLLSVIGCTQQTEDVEEQTTATEERVVLPPSKAYPVPENPGKFTVYPFKSGTFAFTIHSPGVVKGTMSIFIDEHGHLETKRSYKTLEDGSEVSIWTIKRGLDIYSVQADTHDVINAKLPHRKSATLDLESLRAEHGSDEAVTAYLNEQGITLLPDETIMGYPCQVYSRKSSGVTITRWVHQGIEFQMAVESEKIPRMITRELIEARFNEQIPDQYFEFPENFEVRKAG